MHSRLITWVLLLGLVVLGTGASVQGMVAARDLQRTGDIAMGLQQWDVAYSYYTLLAERFPGTPHGRMAELRLKTVRGKLAHPAKPHHMEHPASWLSELFDHLTWP